MTTINDVKQTHPAYNKIKVRTEKVDHVCDSTVKNYATRYLPVPGKMPPMNPALSRSLEYIEQYNWQEEVVGAKYVNYLFRALFFGFTRRTLNAAVGALFRKPPQVALPPQIEYLVNNTDGAGMGLVQQAKELANGVWRHGRAALLVDMPRADGPISVARLQGGMGPRIMLYDHYSIINWKTTGEGEQERLALVVLKEEFDQDPDGFAHKKGERYRVLRLVDGVYVQQVWTQSGDDWLYEEFVPTEGGQPMGRIPFYPCGSVNNSINIQPLPLEDMCEVNLAHYRNSADLEESGHICGQPTLVVAPGQTMDGEQFARANPGGVVIGSTRGINVGAGGSAELLQATENSMIRQMMLDKEQQAIMIGAQLITQGSNQTAEAARIGSASDSSVMATIADNISDAYYDALRQCALFVGANPDDVQFTINRDFWARPMTAQDRQVWASDVMSGTLPMTAYYAALRRAGELPEEMTDEQIADELGGNV